MARQLLALFSLLAFFSCIFATFTYIQSLDGMGPSHTNLANNFTQPRGLDYYNGHLYVADQFNDYIYMLSNNTVITRSGGSSYIDGPRALRIDGASGKIYIADYDNAKVRIALSSSQFSDLGKLDDFRGPSSLVFVNDSIYVLDSVNSKITELSKSREVTVSSKLFTSAGDSQLSTPTDIAYYNGNFYVADTGNNRIVLLSSNLSFLQSIGIGKGGVQLKRPQGVLVHNNVLYVSDTGNKRIVAFAPDGYPIETFSGGTASESMLLDPTDLAFAGTLLYVADTGAGRVKVYNVTMPAGDPSVLAQINDASASISKLQSLITTAATLGIPATSDAPTTLATATSSYNNFRYSDASDQARAAKLSADSQYATLSQQVTIKLRQLTTNATSALATYPESSTPSSLLPQRSSLSSKIAQVDSAISAGNFSAAASIATTLPSLASSFSSAMAAQSTSAQSDALVVQKQQYYLVILSTRDSLALLSSKATTNRQPLQTAQASSLLDVAKSSVDGGDFAAANSSLSQAKALIAQLSSSLEERISDSKVALDAISQASAQVSSLEAQKLILYPNMQPARALLAQADEAAPTDPEKAGQLAAEAVSVAGKEASNARTLSYVVLAVGGVAIIVVLVVIGLIYYLKKKKHKGL